MVTDQIADLLTRIRNALRARHSSVLIPISKEKENILKLLIAEGYLKNYVVEQSKTGKDVFRVMLAYENEDTSYPVIRELVRISKPGRRVYVGKKNLPKVKGGLGVVAVSTSRGLLSDREARKQGIGGELVFLVF